MSATLAAAAGSTPAGSGTSIPSAKGTASLSAIAPPQWPPARPNPYIEIGGTRRQFDVCPAAHIAHAPQLIWKGTTTRSPGATLVTSEPTSSTSATHSCPKQSGIGNGVAPSPIGRSMSQVAIASGRTTAASGLGGGGSGIERHWKRPPGSATSARIFGRFGRIRCRAPPSPVASSRLTRSPASRSSATRVAGVALGATWWRIERAQPRTFAGRIGW